MKKLEKLADSNEKLRTLKAVKQLQQAAKHASGRTTIVQVSWLFELKIVLMRRKHLIAFGLNA